ncbi:MAG: aspartate--tRNA ligase [bacterium]|nr:aspartate--tRNA ligase [bacterium]
MKRTHNCGELNEGDIGKQVILMGWVNSRRDHGGLIFIDLRDRYGLTQIVFNSEIDQKSHKEANVIRDEYVLAIEGEVKFRPAGTDNVNLPTGKIEIIVKKLDILNRSLPLPFALNEGDKVGEDVRLRYRFLDLRRGDLQKNILLRHKVGRTIRNFLDQERFCDIETPFLTKSTPEGARDFLVPSRLSPGKFFALPQSPQLFKQLLMISGFERYYQIVKCFRDEDLRADRQPEFTQVDLEMSFVSEEDVMNLTEGMFKSIWKELNKGELKTPLRRLDYKDAILKYGSDKPDLRFDLEIIEVSDIVKLSQFEVFKKVVDSKGVVRGIKIPNGAGFSRQEIDKLTEEAKIFGAKGLAWLKIENNEIKSPIAKFFTPDILEKIKSEMKGENGDLLVFVADKVKIVWQSLGHLRNYLANKLNLIDNKKYEFAWIINFPLFEYSEEDKRYVAMHHPFTSPNEGANLNIDPGEITARAYDLVLNGNEIGGGSIRIHQREMQEKMFELLKIGKEEAEGRFGFLLEALAFGAPPHGGIAFGLDRLIMILIGTENIREVIAFPKTQKATCLLTGAPDTVSEKQLKELSIKTDNKV